MECENAESANISNQISENVQEGEKLKNGQKIPGKNILQGYESFPLAHLPSQG